MDTDLPPVCVEEGDPALEGVPERLGWEEAVSVAPLPTLGDPEPEGDTRCDRVGAGDPVELCEPTGVEVAQEEGVSTAVPVRVPPGGVNVELEDRLPMSEEVGVDVKLPWEVGEEVGLAPGLSVAPKDTVAEEL